MNDLLTTAWGIDDTPELVTGKGINNEIWRVPSGYWLTRCNPTTAQRLTQEAALYTRINELAEEAGSPIRAPRVVHTAQAEPFYDDGASLWRLTEHLPGVHPDRSDLRTFVSMAKGVAELDRLLAQIPHSYAVYQGPAWLDSLAENLSHLAALLAGSVPLLPVETDLSPLREAAAVISAAMPGFQAEPLQLIHGDCCPPNVKVRSESDATVTGFLDFEFCSPAPRYFEVATLVLALRAHSDEALIATIPTVLAAYERGVGEQLDRERVGLAVIGYDVTSYMYHRLRVARGQAPIGLMEGRSNALQRLMRLMLG